MNLDKDERIEDLQCKGLKIIQNKNLYTFTSDAVVLANFIKTKRNDNCVEIGTGSGVISILLSAKTNFNSIKAFELQKEMSDLAKKNVSLNKLEGKIDVINDDIENFKKHICREVDVVFSNPPYMKEDVLNANDVKSKARHDKSLPIEKLCQVSSKMLKSGGKLFLVYSSSRSAELIYHLKKNRLEPKRMFFTENGKGKTILFVVEAVKDGKSGVEVLPNLVTNDKDGSYLETLHTKYVK